MNINPDLTLGNILTVVSAVAAVLLAIGRLSAKIDGMREQVRELAEELKAHSQEDARRFEEMGRVLYRLSGKLGNGG